MPLSALHKHLIRRSFARLAAHSEESTAQFYQRLVAVSPGHPLLSDKCRLRCHRMLQLLALVVTLIDEPVLLTTQVQHINTAYRHHGLQNEHFSLAGTAFLWVIEQRLGEDFTGEVRAAWTNFYDLLSHLAAVSTAPIEQDNQGRA